MTINLLQNTAAQNSITQLSALFLSPSIANLSGHNTSSTIPTETIISTRATSSRKRRMSGDEHISLAKQQKHGKENKDYGQDIG